MDSPIQLPPSTDLWRRALEAVVREEIGRKEVEILGVRHAADTLHLRFRAPLSIPWVQVHVQSTAPGGLSVWASGAWAEGAWAEGAWAEDAGSGGGTSYNSSVYVSSTETDCRSDRMQDISLADLPYQRYVVFLIPVQYDGSGTKVLYDGEGGRPNHMTFTDLGV